MPAYPDSDVASEIEPLILTHLRRYPGMELLDIYKLLHQAAFGVGHRIPNRKAAREWLEQESHLRPSTIQEPLVESVHPAGIFVRVHLRPFVARGGQINVLVDAYIRSGEIEIADPARLKDWWTTFETMLSPGGTLVGQFDLRQTRFLRQSYEMTDWAGTHHSPGFIARYQPAYRILSAEQAQALCSEHGFGFSVV